MRILVCLSIVALASACASVDRLQMSSFEPMPGQEFRFVADSASLQYPTDSAEGEAVRRAWLEKYLADNGLCPRGYEIVERKPVVTQQTAFGPAHRIFYRGRCKA